MVGLLSLRMCSLDWTVVYGQHRSVYLDVSPCSLAGGSKVSEKHATCVGRVQVSRTRMWSGYNATCQEGGLSNPRER
jgi:hypothetical protein